LDANCSVLNDSIPQVILLVGLEGMSYEEVALVPGMPIGTVRSRLSRGRDQLRKLMGVEDDLRLSVAKSESRQRRTGRQRQPSAAGRLAHTFQTLPRV